MKERYDIFLLSMFLQQIIKHMLFNETIMTALWGATHLFSMGQVGFIIKSQSGETVRSLSNGISENISWYVQKWTVYSYISE